MMVQGVMTPPKTTLGRTDVMQRKADSMMEESDTRTSLAACPGAVGSPAPSPGSSPRKGRPSASLP
jgi:hypothetical protein